jgi:hypothetical protein
MKKIAAIVTVGALALGATACATVEDQSASHAKTTSQQAPAKHKTHKKSDKPKMTSGQENALESAQSYLETGSFSKKGLMKQLTSSYGEDFSKADATFAIKHVDVNWKDEAVESAKSYLDSGSFSRSKLIAQLTSSYGEGFTQAQAEYAVSKVY